ADALGRKLGVPVVPIQANKKRGLEGLRSAIAEAAGGSPPGKGVAYPEAFEREVEDLRARLGGEVPLYLARRLLLDVGGYAEQRLAGSPAGGLRASVEEARRRLAGAGCPVPAVEARARYGWIREVTAGCVRRPAQRPVTWTDRLDRVLTH